MQYASGFVFVPVLIVALLVPRQDGDLPSHLANDERARAHIDLERLLLERFLAPYDEWVIVSGPQAEFAQGREDEFWYVLVVKPPKAGPGRVLSLKFSLNRRDRRTIQRVHMCEDGNPHAWEDTESLGEYMQRRRGEILRALEHYFVQEMRDQEAADTMRNGTPSLYRLGSKDTPVDSLRREDLIY